MPDPVESSRGGPYAYLVLNMDMVGTGLSRLPQESRKNVFNLAEKEITKMLGDNLLDKFKATPDYKEIVGDVVLVASARSVRTTQIMDSTPL